MSDPKMLNIEGAHRRLNELGIECSLRQVRRWAELRSLPFRKPKFGRMLLVREDELVAVATCQDDETRHKLATGS